MFDLQVNGIITKDFSCNFWACPDNDAIDAMVQYQADNGVDKFLATIITDSLETIEANLKRIQDYSKHKPSDQGLVGVHLEGGLISRLGVHPREHAEIINYQNARDLINKFSGLIKLWTLCPRLDRDGDITRLAQDSGITVSYGHSKASYQEAMDCFDKYQVRVVTHWANAMYVADGFKQRDSSDQDLAMLDDIDVAQVDPASIGIGLAAYRHPEVYCMAIAGSKQDHDLHIDPKLLLKLAQHKQEKLILVSDSVAYDGPMPPPHLVGGLNNLGAHAQNAIDAGIPEAQVRQACCPYLGPVLTHGQNLDK